VAGEAGGEDEDAGAVTADAVLEMRGDGGRGGRVWERGYVVGEGGWGWWEGVAEVGRCEWEGGVGCGYGYQCAGYELSVGYG